MDSFRSRGLPLCASAMVCPGALQLYGESAGGFCCDGTPSGGSCGGASCALDPYRQGAVVGCPVYEDPRCVASGSHHAYGTFPAQFCCDSDLTATLDGCTGQICALNRFAAAGQPLCEAGMSCPEGQTLYGQSAGGFCCDGTVNAGGGVCTGTVCALDATRTSGNTLCP